MVGNEELVSLYLETDIKKNKEIIFKKLYNSLKKEAMKICHFYNKALSKTNNNDFFEDLEQEAQICLFKCIDRFQDNKSASFATFYYKCLKNHLANVFNKKFNTVINEMVDTSILSWQKNIHNTDIEESLDNKTLFNILESNIENLPFKKSVHKNIFKEYVGFTEDKNTDESFASLSRKYDLSRMAVKKICDRYLAILKTQLQDNGDIDKVKIFL